MHSVERAWQKPKRKMIKTLLKMSLKKTTLLKKIPRKEMRPQQKKRKSQWKRWRSCLRKKNNRPKNQLLNHLKNRLNLRRPATSSKRNKNKRSWNRNKRMKNKKSMKKRNSRRPKNNKRSNNLKRKNRRKFRLLIKLKRSINKMKNCPNRSSKRKWSSKNVSLMSSNGRKSNKLNSKES